MAVLTVRKRARAFGCAALTRPGPPRRARARAPLVLPLGRGRRGTARGGRAGRARGEYRVGLGARRRCAEAHARARRAQVKDVVDGDLCEQFSQMPADKQRAVAEELERTPGEVLKKLEDLRNALL